MITAFIPARGGSKGIKNKNIYPICGKPLIYWVLQALETSSNINEIIVATDSRQIEQTVLSFNFSKVKIYNRKKENAQDTSATIDVVLEYIDNVKDTFLLVQATSPLLQTEDIDNFIQQYKTQNFTSSFSCVEFPRICWSPDGKPLCHDIKLRKRRQEMDKILVENGAMYINSAENIKKEKSLLSGKILPFKMSYETITEIDEPKDIEIVENILKQRIKPDLKNYKIFLMDCDGVLTDGGMYYSENGEVLKKFNTNDGMGIAQLKSSGIYVAIITGENTLFAKQRAQKLGIDCYSGIKDKLACVNEIVKKFNTDISKVIYIGDDLNDLEVIKNVGFSACPSNAQPIIKQRVNYITKLSGGCGAIRELIDYIT